MWKLLRRLFVLALVGGGGYAVYTAWQRRRETQPEPTPTWPPLDESPPAAADDATTDESPPAAADDATTDESPPAATDEATRWVPPVDGECPPGYPIKGNDNSGIYHVPGGRFYDRTVPERCYANEDDARADGYRRAKA